MLFSATILGRPIVKKNTARRYRRIVCYSPKFIQWEKQALLQLGKLRKINPLIDFPIEARFRFYFTNKMAEPDVSNLIEGPQDLLKKAGIISDDRIIQRVTGEKYFGQEARTEIEIYKYD